LTATLLTCLYQVAHVERWANFEDAGVLQGRMLDHEFLGFCVGAVGGCDLAVFPA